MEVSLREHGSISQATRKGGLRTLPFIMANEIFEKVASIGLQINMILYLTKEYHMESATGASVLFIWSAGSHFLPLFGAFISDSYFGRFLVITIGSIVSLMGMTLLWFTALFPKARPPPCNFAHSPRLCATANGGQLALLFTSFALMSLGAGGIRPCSLAFGADQLRQPAATLPDGEVDPKKKKQPILQSYFNWYYASVGLSFMASVTIVVYIQSAKGWKVGFGVPVGLMLLSAVMFLAGSLLYVKVQPNQSVFTGFAQVIVAAAKNRRISLPLSEDDGAWYCGNNGLKNVQPSSNLRFYNKACLIKDRAQDLNVDGTSANPWRLCTVKQVEDLKSVLRILPIWSTGIIIANSINQHSFPVLQAAAMDRHLGDHFEIPPGSYAIFGITTLTVWVAIYDRLIVPRLTKVTGLPRGLTFKQRMGIGLVLSCIATAVAAMIENKRRTAMVNHHIKLTAMWLAPQHCLMGLAEAFNAIGQIEFYYSELPKGVESMAVALFSLGFGVGNLVGSIVIEVVRLTTKSWGDGQSWLANDLNQGRYDYYYWVLTCLGLVNVIWFWLCSRWYGKEGQNGWLSDDDEEDVNPANTE